MTVRKEGVPALSASISIQAGCLSGDGEDLTELNKTLRFATSIASNKMRFLASSQGNAVNIFFDRRADSHLARRGSAPTLLADQKGFEPYRAVCQQVKRRHHTNWTTRPAFKAMQ